MQIDYEAFVKDVENRLVRNECTEEYSQGAKDTLEVAKCFMLPGDESYD